ncbi:winged helix-turn-helix transcriptional regulator [Kutzneria sp. CA-103260]|uniref:winged helix-turn-helix transcriptional regulator n=1 Tax=Kutzneria sp. CA-103260 TaxID=2802641 RepID=UPI001BA4EA64|nr:helix-turn-helix domain-containing protein [Kutzneria sp. CA-103260]QUQ64222.1 HxlR family transcriptional regulator [Kutzneria sp. CA-103260]
MTTRSSWEAAPCPIARGADVLGDPWTLLILRQAMLGHTRFDQLRDEIGISDNILAARLRRLVAAGLFERVPYRDERGRARQEYRLTAAGLDTLPVLHALAAWGDKHTRADNAGEPLQIIHQKCGNPVSAGNRCAHCRRTVKPAEIAWLRPWLDTEPTALAPAVAPES